VLSNNATGVSYYANISSVDSNGTTNKTLIISGSTGAVNIPNAQGVYTQDLYVPTIELAAGKRIIIDLFVNNTSGNNHTVTFEFRGTRLSHVHTTIIGNIATGPTGSTGPTGPFASDALAWTTYTPTWTAETGTVSIGNGILTGSYKQIGKTVFFTARIKLGTTSSVSGSGGWRVGLPFESVTAPSIIANATYLDNGTAYYGGIANNEFSDSTTFVSPLCLVSPVTGALTPVTATTPFTWTTDDSLLITGTYQAV
jgi:hypothetical protein